MNAVLSHLNLFPLVWRPVDVWESCLHEPLSVFVDNILYFIPTGLFPTMYTGAPVLL